MNYKDLANNVLILLSTPAKAWATITQGEERRNVAANFVYPLIGLCGLSVFIGTFIGNTAGISAFQIAMTRCCATFVSLFGGYFLASYFIDWVGQKFFSRTSQLELIQQFVGYSMVVIFVLNIISGLFVIEIVHWILQFYIVLVAYEGARQLLQVEEENLTKYTLVASITMLVAPFLINYLFNALSVNLS
ncbi:MAG: Yip1 family protein [Phocaeicola sp.]